MRRTECVEEWYLSDLYQSVQCVQQYLISEGPGCPHTLLDVFDEAVTGLQTRVVVQGRPDLTANLLKHRERRDQSSAFLHHQRHGERESFNMFWLHSVIHWG